MPKDILESIHKGIIHKLNFKIQSGTRILKEANLHLNWYFEFGFKIYPFRLKFRHPIYGVAALH